MSNRPNKRSDPGQSQAGWVIVIALITLAAPAYAGWLLGGRSWSTTAIAVTAALYALLVVVLVLVLLLVRKYRNGREWTDDRAQSMSSRRDIAPLTQREVAKDTARLGPQTIKAGTGVRIGTAIRTKQPLYGPWEFTQLWFMGPRMGKTTSQCIPHIVATGGPVLATANKPDLLNATRGPRSEIGRVWISDPQQIAGEPPSWWWNPLSYITAGFGAVSRAQKLAGLFQASYASPNASTDAYFGPGGESLLSDLLLAAALSGEPITRVYDWLTFPDGEAGIPNPVELLRQHGMDMAATALTGHIRKTAKQRDGLYGTAQGIMQFLREPEFLPWITPTGPDDTRRQFDPVRFVTSRETLYLLSQEGAGSARAITAALVNAVFAAAEEKANASRGGRLPVPLLCELDEAANICRLPQLPEVYSHFGGKGIILVTILQSREQGVRAWGEGGLESMVSAASIMGIGGGIRDDDHLAGMSRLIGQRQVLRHSTSSGTRGQRSSSRDVREEAIFPVEDLAAFPRGRGVVFIAGTRPTLVSLDPWYDQDPVAAAKITASIECYSPVDEAEDLLGGAGR
ncbi:type IV secretory system conjugative DNA transfer family protein [Allobranchiibius sp. GilTou38]|uniref:type IV secretory system conjugative DNA transfer family protein n=1 Tax=Allobranchiibius sp. GilTou38 TaxID=2815210 RepID=UPI001AA1C900|nr:type IV secretory system conjugative DNA transfer family protein [Allobranchiibius sp. GilTou38]MBO1768251.1 TraM recognition domain-containing protein [Allobranchiibius sp. GilTou38]